MGLIFFWSVQIVAFVLTCRMVERNNKKANEKH
jgi:hypothetical protein